MIQEDLYSLVSKIRVAVIITGYSSYTILFAPLTITEEGMPESGASKLYYDLESRIHLDSHGSEGLTSYTVTTGPCYVEDQHSRPHPSLKLQHLY